VRHFAAHFFLLAPINLNDEAKKVASSGARRSAHSVAMPHFPAFFAENRVSISLSGDPLIQSGMTSHSFASIVAEHQNPCYQHMAYFSYDYLNERNLLQSRTRV
jgi:hypothetical protein